MEASGFVQEVKEDQFFLTTLRHTKSLKSLLEKLNSSEVQSLLELTACTYANLQGKASSTRFEETIQLEKQQQKKFLQDQFTTKLDTLTSTHEFEVSQYKKEIFELKQHLAVSEATHVSLRENIMKLVNELVSSKDLQYQSEIKRLQTNHDSSLKQQIQRMETFFQGTIATLKEDLVTRQCQIQSLEEQLKKHTEKSLVSVERGKIGEKEFEEMVTNYTNWTLENVSKRAHHMDCRCLVQRTPVLFEIKNYKDDVPTKEVTKFERDIGEHLDVPFGCFISLNTGIQGKKDGHPYHLVWTSNHQLLLYINHFYTHNPSEVFSFLEICTEIASTVYKAAQDKPNEEETCNRLMTQIKMAKTYLDNELPRLAALATTFSRDKKTLMDTIEMNHSHYMIEVNQIKSSIKAVVAVLVGKPPEEDQEQQEEPAEKPKKGRSSVSKKKGESSVINA